MRKTVTLEKGITVGEKTYREAVLRPPTAMDVIEAMQDAEVVIQVPSQQGDGRMEAQLVTSPTRVGINVMLRQLEKIGEFTAPFDRDILAKLSPADLNILQREAELLEAASLAVAQRGCTEGEGAADSEGDQ